MLNIFLSHFNSFNDHFSASGKLISSWRWKSGRILSIGWTNGEEAVFVQDDGTVLIYDVHGDLTKTFNFGSEAKDLKVAQAKIFQVRKLERGKRRHFGKINK